jgi:hypothetical protein
MKSRMKEWLPLLSLVVVPVARAEDIAAMNTAEVTAGTAKRSTLASGVHASQSRSGVRMYASVVAQQRSPILDQLAKTYGGDSWNQVEAIRFTFNVEPPKLSRSWVWEPKADRISYDGPDKDGKPIQITYSHSQLASQSEFVKEMVDPAFTNDQYALLLPLHFAWDTAVMVEDAGMQKGHLTKGSARKIVVRYPSASGGYTPGDTWELFLGTDGRLQEIVLRHGGSVKPAVTYATWADHKQAGPLLISTDKHGTGDGQPIHLFFTNVAVKLVGSSTWIDAK